MDLSLLPGAGCILSRGSHLPPLAGDSACLPTVLQNALGPQRAFHSPCLTTGYTPGCLQGTGGHPRALTLSDDPAFSSHLWHLPSCREQVANEGPVSLPSSISIAVGRTKRSENGTHTVKEAVMAVLQSCHAPFRVRDRACSDSCPGSGCRVTSYWIDMLLCVSACARPAKPAVRFLGSMAPCGWEPCWSQLPVALGTHQCRGARRWLLWRNGRCRVPAELW